MKSALLIETQHATVDLLNAICELQYNHDARDELQLNSEHLEQLGDLTILLEELGEIFDSEADGIHEYWIILSDLHMIALNDRTDGIEDIRYTLSEMTGYLIDLEDFVN